MQLILLFICLLLAGSGASYAQPGYQGKKLSAQANLLVFPALKNATFGKAPSPTSLNITKELTLDYVISRRNTLGVSYQNFHTSSLRNYDADATIIPRAKVYSHAFGLYYRIFKRKTGNLAPLGKYTQVGIKMMLNRTENNQGTSGPVSFTNYAISIGKGRSKIFFDRLIFSYGVELSHVFTGLSKEGLKGATFYYKDDAQTMAQYRIWRHSLLNLKMGVGFLAL